MTQPEQEGGDRPADRRSRLPPSLVTPRPGTHAERERDRERNREEGGLLDPLPP